MGDNIEDEFKEMKERYEKFTKNLFVDVKNIKENVFYNIVDENRTKEKLMAMARATRPFLAKELWDLLDDYMNFLRNLPGTEGGNYKVVYENFSKADLVKRLLFKRPVVFCGPSDLTLMRNSEKGTKCNNHCAYDTAKNLDVTTGRTPYLREYISYDENLLSSLIGMSTPTYYFNIGAGNMSHNLMMPHIDEGILCGLVGARNEKIGFMEHRFVFPRNEASHANCHLSDDFWIQKVYKDTFPEGIIPTVEDIKSKPEIYASIYVNGINEKYLEKRLMLSIVPYIKEAAIRGIEAKKDVFCSVPPIGGGCWTGRVPMMTIHRLIVNGVLKFLDTDCEYKDIKALKALVMPPVDANLYDLFVARRNIKEIKVESESEIVLTFNDPTNHKIKIINQIRYVAALLPKEFENCLSIAGYAWDGNSFPGNEYWIGGMTSFDPQAIYCSLLGQFQNPEVNFKMADPERIRVY